MLQALAEWLCNHFLPASVSKHGFEPRSRYRDGPGGVRARGEREERRREEGEIGERVRKSFLCPRG